jgi:hypothetical protein
VRRAALVVFAFASRNAAAAPKCQDVDEHAAVVVATAPSLGEWGLAVTAETASETKWNEAGNEAVVLEVSAKRGLVGHLILHQGHTKFAYTMHVGALAAGESVEVKVSPLTAAKAKKKASVCAANLIPGDEGVANAPELRWPVQKTFNDVPLLVGWSKAHKSYQTVMTNEDGGTAEICGGGAAGMQAEISRWGRSTDIEDHYHYGNAPTWERCTGRATMQQVRMEGAHPILYWGNGHNRLFENRGGYGAACGARKPEKPDGDLAGWNVANPSNELEADAGKVVILRPLPVDLDALDYPKFGGRREALADHYAPWMYRLSALELEREGKIDHKRTFAMDRYLYVDIQVSNVGGHGGTYCAAMVSGGFRLRAVTSKGIKAESAQITAQYAFGGHHDWKRVAIPLPKGFDIADLDHYQFDAYDKDGIYVTGLGDAFVPRPEGDNGAKLDYVRRNVAPLYYYVDDDRSSCIRGFTTAGPNGAKYICNGGQVDLPK